MLLLSQSHFLHFEDVRGVGSDRLTAVPSLILGEHSLHPPRAQAQGSWGDLTAAFWLFLRSLLESLNGNFQQKPPLFFFFIP